MAQHMQEFCVGLTSYVALLQGVSGAEASSIALRAVALIRAATTSRGVLRSGMYELYEVRSLLWDSLHYVHWKDTCDLERELYTVVTAVLVATVLQSSHSQPLNYETLAQTLDIGLLMGSPSVAPVVLPLLSCIQSQLCSDGRSISRTDDQLTGLRRKLSEQRIQILNQHRTYTPDVSMPSIERNPSVVSFYRRYFEPQLPLVLTSCMDDWPALKPLAEGGSPRWANLNYLLSIIGHRTVPVETGSSYLGADSGSSFMTGRQFVEKYILGSSDGCADSTKQPANAIITNNLAGADAQSSDGGVGTDSAGGALAVPAAGYLAQHRLLDQIPRLKEDIITPDYCALLSEVDETTAPTGETAEAADEVKVQAWLGPVGTVSPLHHDPYYNLLAQVTGYKYIRIYNPRNSACLCPMPGRMSNNSRVDLLRSAPELQADHPELFSAPYMQCVLAPGEMLFLPRWWWHFIVAIDRETALRWRTEHGIKESASRQGVAHGDYAEDSEADAQESCNPQAVLGKRKHSGGQLPARTESEGSDDSVVDFSFSVSFWWGARVLKE